MPTRQRDCRFVPFADAVIDELHKVQQNEKRLQYLRNVSLLFKSIKKFSFEQNRFIKTSIHKLPSNVNSRFIFTTTQHLNLISLQLLAKSQPLALIEDVVTISYYNHFLKYLEDSNIKPFIFLLVSYFPFENAAPTLENLHTPSNIDDELLISQLEKRIEQIPFNSDKIEILKNTIRLDLLLKNY
jgi:hypothetical protein